MTTTSLTAEEVRASMSMLEAIDAVRQAFLDLNDEQFEQPTRIALRDGMFLIMSAHHKPTASAMVKTLSLNFERIPSITGTVVWTNTTSRHRLVADAGSITALRTGAIVGVATDLLAPVGANRMVLVGAGAQAADQFRGVHAVRPLTSLTVVNASRARSQELLDRIGDELSGIEATTSSSIDEAIADADIVCCATPATTPLFTASALPAQVHINAIGAFRPTMRELPNDLLADATVYVDDLDAVLEESGEILDGIAVGAIVKADLIQLGDALRRKTLPQTRRTVFKTVGVAVQDWAVAHALATKLLRD